MKEQNKFSTVFCFCRLRCCYCRSRLYAKSVEKIEYEILRKSEDSGLRNCNGSLTSSVKKIICFKNYLNWRNGKLDSKKSFKIKLNDWLLKNAIVSSADFNSTNISNLNIILFILLYFQKLYTNIWLVI